MRLAALVLVAASCSFGQWKGVNPSVEKIVNSVSEERISETMRKLESFGTRDLFSEDDNPMRGIGAARHWIFDQFKSYSPRLQVRFDTYRVKKKARIVRDVELNNVVAVLPGKLNPERQFILSGHYDSLALTKTLPNFPFGGGQSAPDELFTLENRAAVAPGVSDDASGIAAVLELARVMSQYEFEKTIVFVAFAGEEEGLVGSTLYATKAHKENQIIDGVLNNDIIGSDISGNGRIENLTVQVYSEDPADSSSRELARYIKDVEDRYLPGLKLELVFRPDRLGRGGDHTPFNQEGYAAVRFTTPNENLANQHTVTDTYKNASVAYTLRAAQANAATLASLALAPKAPVTWEPIASGPRKGQPTPTLGRGKSRYDAALRWKDDNPEPDLLGYAVVMRKTTSPYWDREIFVGNVTEYVLKDVSIDDNIFGVKAIDRDGNESLVSPYVASPRSKLEIETY